jgi:RNA polymerase sigma-70 factor (ECF subfamily)
VRKVPNKEIAQDLVQDTFIAAFQAFPSFKNESEPLTWLHAILHRKIADFYRQYFKKQTVAFLEKEHPVFFQSNEHWTPEQSELRWNTDDSHLLDNEEFSLTLKDCLNKLPNMWQAIMSLKFLEEKDSKQICKDLGISQSNFWQIVHRAKLNLRSCLAQNWFSSH